MNTRTAIALVAIGCAFFAVSWVWPHVFGGRNAWSQDDAAQLAAVQTEIHSLRAQTGVAIEKHKAGAADSELDRQTAEKLQASERRYKHLTTQLETARDKGQTIATVLRWLGVTVGLAGLVSFTIVQSRED